MLCVRVRLFVCVFLTSAEKFVCLLLRSKFCAKNYVYKKQKQLFLNKMFFCVTCCFFPIVFFFLSFFFGNFSPRKHFVEFSVFQAHVIMNLHPSVLMLIFTVDIICVLKDFIIFLVSLSLSLPFQFLFIFRIFNRTKHTFIGA